MKLKLLALFAMLLSVQLAFAQRTVTGKVADAESNEALVGATVIVTGTTTGTSTDSNGSFSLNVPDGANSLTVTYTGYEKQEVAINGQSTVIIALRSNAVLEEVVVTGYAVEKKKDLLGAVAVLDLRDV